MVKSAFVVAPWVCWGFFGIWRLSFSAKIHVIHSMKLLKFALLLAAAVAIACVRGEVRDSVKEKAP